MANYQTVLNAVDGKNYFISIITTNKRFSIPGIIPGITHYFNHLIFEAAIYADRPRIFPFPKPILVVHVNDEHPSNPISEPEFTRLVCSIVTHETFIGLYNKNVRELFCLFDDPKSGYMIIADDIWSIWFWQNIKHVFIENISPKPSKTFKGDAQANAENNLNIADSLGKDMADYLDKSERSAQEQIETIRRMWAGFPAEPNNTEDLLKEKAKTLASVILTLIRSHTETFAHMSKGDTTDKISYGELFTEIASIYLSLIDRFAFSVLNEGHRNIFTDTLYEEFIARSLLKNYKENADLMLDAEISDLKKRLEAYSLLPFSDPNKKGSLIREFADNILKIIGKEKHALFLIFIENAVLRDLDILQLNKLLIKEK